MDNQQDRVLASRMADAGRRPLEEFEVEAVAGGSRYFVAANPNSGNIASDESYWVFD